MVNVIVEGAKRLLPHAAQTALPYMLPLGQVSGITVSVSGHVQLQSIVLVAYVMRPLTFNSFNTVFLDSSSSFLKALLLVTPVISIIICQTWSSGNSHNRCSSFHKEARYHPYACASDQEN